MGTSLSTTPGDFTEVGTAIVNFERDEDDLAVLLYVSLPVSGEPEPGMQALISRTPQRADKQVRIIEDTADTVHVVLPAKPTELTDEQLDQAAGGTAKPPSPQGLFGNCA